MARDSMGDGLTVSAMVAVADVEIGARLRPVSGAAVEALMASIDQVGLIQPIQLREGLGKRLILIAGAHRLEAHKRLKLSVIRAEIRACDDAQAELIEIEENLVEAELTMLDLAVHLARQKALYEALNPETRNGTIGASARWGDATDTVSFASAVAERRGMSERHVRRLTRIGAGLSPASVVALRAAPKLPTYRILADLAEAADADQQAAAARAIAEGRAKRVVDALTLARGEAPTLPRPADERAFDALRQAFDRAPAAARGWFLEHLAEHCPTDLDRAARAVARRRATA